jgi:chaperonin cofactor prefoldin
MHMDELKQRSERMEWSGKDLEDVASHYEERTAELQANESYRVS